MRCVRDVDRRDGQFLAQSDLCFNASFILGGQINGEPPSHFRIYAEGNFIEEGADGKQRDNTATSVDLSRRSAWING